MNDVSGILRIIAESKISEAMAKGEFDDLPGKGKPLVLEDLGSVPEELRMAYKILKNSGHLPPELEDRKEAANIMELLDNCSDEGEKLRQMAKLRVLAERIGSRLANSAFMEANDEYYQKILAKINVHRNKKA